MLICTLLTIYQGVHITYFTSKDSIQEAISIYFNMSLPQPYSIILFEMPVALSPRGHELMVYETVAVLLVLS